MRSKGGVAGTAAMAVLGLVTLAAPASAGTEAPRQTYTDTFTTEVPGAATGRTYAIDYLNPEDPEGKPHSFSQLRVELADGARFDTSAIPRCNASDAELMAAGPSACPAETQVGTDETVVDTGVPGPGRYFTVDFAFFNNEDQLILVASVRENGLRVVVRGKIHENTLVIDNPFIPGTPPDGAAAKSQRGRFEPRASVRDGVQLNYLTTPPTCPERGYWVNRVVYTYRDGVKQTAESRSPCRPPGQASADARAPRIRAAGIPRRCTRRGFRATFRIVDASRVRSARIRLNSRRVASARRRRLKIWIPARRLRGGRHKITVIATDAAGNRRVRRFRFRRCRT